MVALLFLKGAGPLHLCLLCMFLAAPNLAVDENSVASVSNTAPCYMPLYLLSCLLHLAAMRSLRTNQKGGMRLVVGWRWYEACREEDAPGLPPQQHCRVSQGGLCCHV
jgi:hypothetical protein